MNKIEQIISFVSPAWGLRREALKVEIMKREFMTTGLSKVRKFNAAERGKSTAGWIAPSTGVNTELQFDLQTLRNRSRELVRNNALAASYVSKLSTKVVGTGIWPRFEGASSSLKQQLVSDWDKFVESADINGQHDLYGLQKLAFRSMLESGEVLFRTVIAPKSARTKFPLQIQILEPDFIDHTINKTLDGGNEIIQGVEFDVDGRRVAIWVFPTHPGETLPFLKGIVRNTAKRVPIGEYNQMFPVVRPGQIHGVPQLAVAALRLRDIAEYEEADLFRAKLAACFGVFIKRGAQAGNTPIQDEVSGGRGRGSGGMPTEFRPGMIVDLPADGSEIQTASPPQVDGAIDFLTYQVKMAAAGLDIPYHTLTGDLTQVNFSSMRAGDRDFYDIIDGWQYGMFIPQFCTPIFNEFEKVRVNLLGRSAIGEARKIWMVPKRPSVDVYKEMLSMVMAIRAGVKSWSQAVAELGGDPQEQVEELKRINKMFDDANVVLDIDARKVSKSGAGQTAPTVVLDNQEQ